MQRLIGAVLVSFVAMLLIGPFVIPALLRLKVGQPIRTDGPKSHAVKQGTPTMGGIMMCVVAPVVALIFAPENARLRLMIPAILFSLGFGLVGFLDDFLKVVRKNPKGLRGWYKIFFQVIISAGLAVFCYTSPDIGPRIYIPFVGGGYMLDMGLFYIPFVMFIAVSVVNSANLNDGLDGLLSGVTLIITATMAIIALFAVNLLGNTVSVTTAVFCGAAAGACLGFLRFNTHPARVFMGDAGSFLLGGIVTIGALFLRQPLLLLILAVTYVASALSDIIQIGYFKYSRRKYGEGRRIFKMAPLHHHFELLGFPETRIVAMYMIVTFVACLIALLAVSV